jgi:hypothetical protein
MTRAPDRTDQDLTIEAAVSRIAREIQLMGLLDAAADRAYHRYGATCLIVDRTANHQSADIKAVIGERDLVDLWDLDPILWDDANWAAIRFVPAGQVSIVHPSHHD